MPETERKSGVRNVSGVCIPNAYKANCCRIQIRSANTEGRKYMSYCTLNSIVGLDVVVVPIVSSRLLLPAMDVSIRDLKPCTAGAIF